MIMIIAQVCSVNQADQLSFANQAETLATAATVIHPA
jgi:hypothetical protein